MKQVTIEWPSGLVERLANVAADKIYTVTEGEGITQAVKLSPPSSESRR